MNDCFVQAVYSDGTVIFEQMCEDASLGEAMARKILRDLTFAGDACRIVSIDGELIWEGHINDKSL